MLDLRILLGNTAVPIPESIMPSREHKLTPRERKTKPRQYVQQKTAGRLALVADEFTNVDIQKLFKLSDEGARGQINQWIDRGEVVKGPFVRTTGGGKYYLYRKVLK